MGGDGGIAVPARIVGEQGKDAVAGGVGELIGGYGGLGSRTARAEDEPQAILLQREGSDGLGGSAHFAQSGVDLEGVLGGEDGLGSVGVPHPALKISGKAAFGGRIRRGRGGGEAASPAASG